MEVTLKRGSVAVQTTSVKAEDANTLILTTASKIQDATYTVTVTEKETTFTGEAEKLTTLAITGENAVVDNADIRKATSATVPYEAKNQFGEDMNVSLTASSSLSPTVSAKNGIITITINATSGSSVSLIEGQIVSVSIVSARVLLQLKPFLPLLRLKLLQLRESIIMMTLALTRITRTKVLFT